MREPLKLGIIGCGRQASKLLLAINEISYIKVVALCDILPSKIETFSSAIKDRQLEMVTTNYQELIAYKAVDAVLIATETDKHMEIAFAALKAGKHIFIEKPLDTKLNDVDEFILAASKKPETLVQVEFPFHHANYFASVSQILDNKEYGGARHINVIEHRGPFLGPWFFDSSKSGGSINDKMIHFFEIANILFSPAVPEEVLARGSQHVFSPGDEYPSVSGGKFKPEKNDIMDHAEIIVTYSDKSVISLSMNLYQQPPIEGTIMTFTSATGKHLRVDIDGSDVVISMAGFDKKTHEYYLVNNNDNDSNRINHPGVIHEFEEFYRAIMEKKQPSANLWQARQSQIIAWAAEESASKRTTVKLDKYNNQLIAQNARRLGWDKIPEFKRYHLIDKEYVVAREEHSTDDWVDKLYGKVRQIFPRKKRVPKLDKYKVEQLIPLLSADKALAESLDRLAGRYKFTLPWDEFTIEIDETGIKLDSTNNVTKLVNELSIELSEKGYEALMTGDSIVMQYLTGDIKVNGELNFLQANQSQLLHFVERLRKELYNHKSNA